MRWILRIDGWLCRTLFRVEWRTQKTQRTQKTLKGQRHRAATDGYDSDRIDGASRRVDPLAEMLVNAVAVVVDLSAFSAFAVGCTDQPAPTASGARSRSTRSAH